MGMFVMFFSGRGIGETKINGQKAKGGETWELGIITEKSYWG